MGPEQEPRDREQLADLQGGRLRMLLAEILPRNQFYNAKFTQAGLKPSDIRTPADLARLPFTTKTELLDDQAAHPPYGSALTYHSAHYSRMHQTSGTSGQPLRWLDTPESWAWCVDCWRRIYDLIGVRPDDRLLFAFSFGPF